MVERVSPGQRRGGSSDPLRRHQVVNDILASKDDYLRRVALGTAIKPTSSGFGQSFIRVKNLSGAARVVGEAMEVGDSLTANLDPLNLWFGADVRGSNGVCGILLEAVPDNGFAWMAVSAPVVLAKADIITTNDTHVHVASADANPQGNFGGPWQILWKPAGETGLQTIALLLGGAQLERKAIADEDIEVDTSGSVSVLINGVDVGSVTAHWDHLTAGYDTITAGSDCRIRWHDDQIKWILIDGVCGA